MITLEQLQPYVDNKLVALKECPTNPDLVLTCYTQNCLHAFDWDDVTRACRGLVFSRKTGKPINNPIPKLFNMNEQPEVMEDVITEKLALDTHKVYHKSNGHLAIVWYHEGKWYNTTKGSWEMEFVEPDRKILQPIIDTLDDRQMINFTFMFEIIADYDKHTLYEEEVARFDQENCAVLLSVRRNTRGLDPRDWLPAVKNILKDDGVIINHEIKDSLTTAEQLAAAYKLTDTEGYIVVFEDMQRVKVKTDDYLAKRYIKLFEDGQFFKRMFKSYAHDIDEALKEIPEEYHYIYEKVMNDFKVQTEWKQMFYETELENYVTMNGLWKLSDNELAKHIAQLPNKSYREFFMLQALRGKLKFQTCKDHFLEHNDWSVYKPSEQ